MFLSNCSLSKSNFLKIDLNNETITCSDGTIFHKDDVISLDGGTGEVMEGAIELVEAGIDKDFEVVSKLNFKKK